MMQQQPPSTVFGSSTMMMVGGCPVAPLSQSHNPSSLSTAAVPQHFLTSYDGSCFAMQPTPSTAFGGPQQVMMMMMPHHLSSGDLFFPPSQSAAVAFTALAAAPQQSQLSYTVTPHHVGGGALPPTPRPPSVIALPYAPQPPLPRAQQPPPTAFVSSYSKPPPPRNNGAATDAPQAGSASPPRGGNRPAAAPLSLSAAPWSPAAMTTPRPPLDEGDNHGASATVAPGASAVHVYTAGYESVLTLPATAIHHMPNVPMVAAAGGRPATGPTRLRLCAQYDAARPYDSCPLMSNCRFVHADTRAVGTTARGVHVNYAWPCISAVTYDRCTPGTTLHVAPPNCKIASDVMDSAMALKTKAFNTRRPLSHCAHYYFNRTCNLGPDCQFVHAVFIDPNAKPGQRAPVPSQLGAERELQLSKKQRDARRAGAVSVNTRCSGPSLLIPELLLSVTAQPVLQQAAPSAVSEVEVELNAVMDTETLKRPSITTTNIGVAEQGPCDRSSVADLKHGKPEGGFKRGELWPRMAGCTSTHSIAAFSSASLGYVLKSSTDGASTTLQPLVATERTTVLSRIVFIASA